MFVSRLRRPPLRQVVNILTKIWKKKLSLAGATAGTLVVDPTLSVSTSPRQTCSPAGARRASGGMVASVLRTVVQAIHLTAATLQRERGSDPSSPLPHQSVMVSTSVGGRRTAMSTPAVCMRGGPGSTDASVTSGMRGMDGLYVSQLPMLAAIS